MSSALTRVQTRALANRSERRLSGELAEAQRPAKIATAKIDGAAFATHVAVSHAAALSSLEARLIGIAPLGEARYKVLVDTFVGCAATELSMLPFKD